MTGIFRIWIMFNFILKSFLFCSILRFADVRVYSHVLLKSPFFTVLNLVAARLCFHWHLLFCSQGGGACVAGGMCGRRDGHCSGWYASCWNALLFLCFFAPFKAPFTPSESGSKSERDQRISTKDFKNVCFCPV